MTNTNVKIKAKCTAEEFELKFLQAHPQRPGSSRVSPWCLTQGHFYQEECLLNNSPSALRSYSLMYRAKVACAFALLPTDTHMVSVLSHTRSQCLQCFGQHLTLSLSLSPFPSEHDIHP